MPVAIPQSRQRLMRWKNGGGMTCEVMRFPQDSSLETFDWRVSVATVHQGGAFSAFPGIDRSLAILEGKGLTLHIDGRMQQLTPPDRALRFDGEAAIHSELIDGSVVDFNVMTRRAACTHTLEHLNLNRQMPLPLDSDTLIYVVNGSCSLSGIPVLQAGDAVLLDADDKPCRIDAGAAELMLVRLYFVR